MQKVSQCQSCKKDFTIEPEDFAFYEKIQVPPPTFCPECRMIRRLCFRNERTLYRRQCNKCNKTTVSVYAPESPYTIYCYDCFYSDDWSPLDYGAPYDFNRPFFEQFQELTLRTPKLAKQVSNDNMMSDYVNHCGGCKNCYLIFAAINNEYCFYGSHISNAKRIVDGHRIFRSENCYDSVDLENCYNIFFSQQCLDSYGCMFLYNCRGSSNCFMSSNLIKKSYYIRNKRFSKSEYESFMKNLSLGFGSVSELKAEFRKLKTLTLQRAQEGINNVGSLGNYLKNTKNCYRCFDLTDAEDCRYVTYGNKVKDCMDLYGAYPTTELCYESVGSGNPSYNCKFTYLPWQATNIEYSINIFPGCHNCFGCNQVKNAQYCILNRQYTKEEYLSMLSRIRRQMAEVPYTDSRGRIYCYGEFFPVEISPFPYNDSLAQEYFPLEKVEAESKGFHWHDATARDYAISKKYSELPDIITDVTDDILKETISCAHEGKCSEQCTAAFRITSTELEFYREYSLPLPRLCPNCRHYARFRMRNPVKLWERQCSCLVNNTQLNTNNGYKNTVAHAHGTSPCPNTFETSYAPERLEVVYCETCYQQEVQ